MADGHGWPGEALSGARPAVFWVDRLPPTPPRPELQGEFEADLVVVGGGFTGLWAALAAVERSAGIALTKRAVRRADEDDGRQGLWLRTLDRFGVGFDF